VNDEPHLWRHASSGGGNGSSSSSGDSSRASAPVQQHVGRLRRREGDGLLERLPWPDGCSERAPLPPPRFQASRFLPRSSFAFFFLPPTLRRWYAPQGRGGWLCVGRLGSGLVSKRRGFCRTGCPKRKKQRERERKIEKNNCLLLVLEKRCKGVQRKCRGGEAAAWLSFSPFPLHSDPTLLKCFVFTLDCMVQSHSHGIVSELRSSFTLTLRFFNFLLARIGPRPPAQLLVSRDWNGQERLRLSFRTVADAHCRWNNGLGRVRGRQC
jgi:hypothetical protein